MNISNNIDVIVFASIIIVGFTVMFVGLGVPIAKEDLRRRKAQRHAREFLASIEESRKGRKKWTSTGGYSTTRFK